MYFQKLFVATIFQGYKLYFLKVLIDKIDRKDYILHVYKIKYYRNRNAANIFRRLFANSLLKMLAQL